MAVDDALVLVARGRALLRIGEHAAAAQAFRFALEQRPGDGAALVGLGHALRLGGELDAAVAAYRGALDRASLEDKVGEAFRGDLRGLADMFRKAVDPRVPVEDVRGEACMGLGAVYLARRQPAKAVRELRKAEGFLPSSPTVQRALGQALLESGDEPAGKRALQRAATATPPDAPALVALARLAARDGHSDEAETLCQQALALTAPEPEATTDGDRRSTDGDRRSTDGDRRSTDDNRAATGDDDGARAAQDLSAIDAVAPRRASERAAARSDAWLCLSSLRLASGDANGAAELARSALAALGDGGPRRHAELALARALRALGRAGDALDLLDLALLRDGARARSPASPASDDRAATLEAALGIALTFGLDERATRYAEQILAPAVSSSPADAPAPVIADARGVEVPAIVDAATPPVAVDAASSVAVEAASPLSDGNGGVFSVRQRSDAFAALARARLRDGKLDEAKQLSARVLDRDSTEAWLTEAELSLAQHDRGGAIAALRRAHELAGDGDDRLLRRVRELLTDQALRGPEDSDADARGEAAGGGLLGLLTAAPPRLARNPETAELGLAAAALVDELSRPLLLTVMGEFNAGKSTFVNAFVGHPVAPTGILPTTATINVFRYGAEPGGRLVYRDDTARAIAWPELPAALRALDETEARRVRLVEVSYPLPVLSTVNLVDTPGLNSILPEHEAITREFIARADAVIWLFRGGQAGARSEREPLERISHAKKKLLGVLTQIDRLEPAEVEAALAHLVAGFGDLVEAVVPVSAKEAQAPGDDPARLLRSNWPELRRVLDERFFRRAQAIKRASAGRKLRAILEEAERRGQAALALADSAPVAAAIADAAAAERHALDDFLVDEERRLRAALSAIYDGAALEVLEFVRPGRGMLAENEASPADRRFLLEHLEGQLDLLTRASLSRVDRQAERAAAGLRGLDPRAGDAFLVETRRLLEQEVYGRYRAFARGYLRRGRLDEFFARLPRLPLGKSSIRDALMKDTPALDVIESELLLPLSGFLRRFFAELSSRLARKLRAEALARVEIEARLITPAARMLSQLALLPVEDEAQGGADAQPGHGDAGDAQPGHGDAGTAPHA